MNEWTFIVERAYNFSLFKLRVTYLNRNKDATIDFLYRFVSIKTLKIYVYIVEDMLILYYLTIYDHILLHYKDSFR